DRVRAGLRAYGDGIRPIRAQTIGGTRRGERPDELVQHVTLPPPLADNPYLQEYYGSVAWSVRAIYADSVGWFDGNATTMFPLPEKERAVRIICLSGGAAQEVSRARDALAAAGFLLSPQPADHVF